MLQIVSVNILEQIHLQELLAINLSVSDCEKDDKHSQKLLLFDALQLNISARGCVIAYARRKTGSPAFIHFGSAVEAVLRSLPSGGFLLPKVALMQAKHRAKEFKRRCVGLGIMGVSLHSYRYAWAEPAKICGYPERFDQEALGHNSKTVHRAYARRVQVKLPSLEVSG